MKYFAIIIAGLLISCSSKIEKAENHFTKIVYDLSDRSDSLKFNNWLADNIKNKNSENYSCEDSIKIESHLWGQCFYSDMNYTVYGGCRGEFGGSLVFIEKSDPSIVYYLLSTCPQMVERRNDAFYITESLAHGSGSGSIMRIDDPKRLFKIKRDSLLFSWKSEMFTSMDSHEIYKKLSNQGQRLIDTTDITFDLFFDFDKNNYLIYSGYKTTYLGLYDDNRIVVLDTLMDYGSWGSIKKPGEIVDGIYHYSYTRGGGTGTTEIRSTGDIYVKNDTIVIGFNYREWPRQID